MTQVVVAAAVVVVVVKKVSDDVNVFRHRSGRVKPLTHAAGVHLSRPNTANQRNPLGAVATVAVVFSHLDLSLAILGQHCVRVPVGALRHHRRHSPNHVVIGDPQPSAPLWRIGGGRMDIGGNMVETIGSLGPTNTNMS